MSFLVCIVYNAVGTRSILFIRRTKPSVEVGRDKNSVSMCLYDLQTQKPDKPPQSETWILWS